jgi:hypothetical protein
MNVRNEGTLVLVGHRNAQNGLWHVNLAKQKIRLANSIGNPTASELVAFAHATLFSPVLSTLEAALTRGYLTNFPGLTPAMLRKYQPRSIAMHKGHMDQKRKNQKSTKNTTPPAVHIPTDTTPDSTDSDMSPPGIDERTHAVYTNVFEATGQIYSDQTGQFVAPSSNGNNYMMIVYDYDSNHIFIQVRKIIKLLCWFW